MSKVVMACPECSRQSNVPNDERVLDVTCPHCQCAFRIRQGRVYPQPDERKKNEAQESSMPMPTWPIMLLIVSFGAVIGILSASYFLMGYKSSWAVFLWMPLGLIVLFLMSNLLLDSFIGDRPDIHRQAISVLLFVCVTLFCHIAWYASDDDDSQLEHPIVRLHEWLGIEHMRSTQAKALMIDARDALLEENYLDANTHLSSLSRLYRSKPDRFYYYHAFVLHQLNEQVGADLNARRYLDRIGAEGDDFAAAHAEYTARLAL